MAKREPILSVLALLLAICLFVGTSAPASWLWQCHHMSRLVAAAPIASPNAMPCHMAGMSMTHMACCAHQTDARVASSGHTPAFRSAPCHPTLSQIANLSAASLSAYGPDLRQLAAVAVAPLPFTPGLQAAPDLSASSPRPPPSASLPAPPFFRSPSLRAPPVG